jgi:hypothetical protein
MKKHRPKKAVYYELGPPKKWSPRVLQRKFINIQGPLGGPIHVQSNQFKDRVLSTSHILTFPMDNKDIQHTNIILGPLT